MAGISHSEFLDTLTELGPSSLLERCIKNGALISTKPATSEMNFTLMANMGYYTTSNALFFTQAHDPAPAVDIKNWRLTVDGDGIVEPLSVNYDELLKFPCVTVTRYLECVDNGRIFYDLLLGRKTKGPQWHFGRYGIAEWTGVPLSTLLRKAKIKKQAVEVIPVGLDNSSGYSIPVAKAMEEDTLVAYIMNGTILPLDHGFPLRALLPGWAGAASTKWISRIIVSAHPVPIAVKTEQRPTHTPYFPKLYPEKSYVTKSVVKSACCLPWPAILRTGHQKIIGYAWSPWGRIARVDVSLDGGNSFKPASLTGPNIERAGTRWEFCFEAQPGNLTIMPCATDNKGHTQYNISQQHWNRQGYLFGAMTPHPITISADSGETYGEPFECSPHIGQCC